MLLSKRKAAVCFGLLVLLMVLCLSQAVYSESASDQPFTPFIESFPIGRIDWDSGVIYGVGRGYLHLNGGSKIKALRTARAIALQSILKLAARIRLDDRQTLKTLGEGRVVIQIKALVRYEEHESLLKKDQDGPFYEVTYRAPMKGVEGLTKRLLGHLKGQPKIWRDFPIPEGRVPEDDEDRSWLVLDARGLKQKQAVQPALFPKVVTEGGETVYDLSKVEEQALVERGMARYVTSQTSMEELQQLSRTGHSLERELSFLLDILSPGSVWAREKKKRKKRGDFIISDVKQAQGIMKTNLVISEGDARDIQKEDASSKILKQCRVIVIVSSPLGGIEGNFKKYFALNQ